MVHLKNERIFYLRAYCSTCGKLLLTSNPLFRKEMMDNWDRSVLMAAGIPCKDCGHEIPNFNINIKIYNSSLDKEYSPKSILPKPKSKLPEFLDNSYSNKK